MSPTPSAFPILAAAIPAAIAAVLTAAPVTAQSVVVPALAAAADAHNAVFLPFGTTQFHTQILIDGSRIAPTGASLTGVRFRLDRSASPIGATLPNLVVRIATSSVAVGAMTTTFGNHVPAGGATQVFQGPLVLPASVQNGVGGEPWTIVIPFAQPYAYTTAAGNLLIDLTAIDPNAAWTGCILDAAEAGGAGTTLGVAGPSPTLDELKMGIGSDPDVLTLGGTIAFTTSARTGSYPGVLAASLTPLSPGLDLGLFGAPGNTLHLDPQALVPLTWVSGFLGVTSTQLLPIPNQPNLLGTLIYGQSAVLDSTANAFGLRLSDAVEVAIGDPALPLGMQQLDADDPNAAIGVIVDYDLTTTARFGAAVVLLEGGFF